MSCGTYPFRYVNATTSGAAQWPSSTVNMQVKETINDLKEIQFRPGARRARTRSWDRVPPASPPATPPALPQRVTAQHACRSPGVPIRAGARGPDLAGDAVTSLAHTGGNQAARAGEIARECWRRRGAGRLWPATGRH